MPDKDEEPKQDMKAVEIKKEIDHKDDNDCKGTWVDEEEALTTPPAFQRGVRLDRRRIATTPGAVAFGGSSYDNETENENGQARFDPTDVEQAPSTANNHENVASPVCLTATLVTEQDEHDFFEQPSLMMMRAASATLVKAQPLVFHENDKINPQRAMICLGVAFCLALILGLVLGVAIGFFEADGDSFD